MDLNAINRLTGEQFEKFLEKILHRMGFENIERTQLSGDFGADLIASRNNKKFVIQAKRYSRPVGNKAVQEVFSSMPVYKADICMVVTNQDFTNAAKKQALECKCLLFGKSQLKELITDTFSSFDELICFLRDEDISKFRITNNQLIEAYFTLKSEIGSSVRVQDMDALGLYSSSVYRRRWGSWNAFLKNVNESMIQEKNIGKDVLVDEFKRVEKLLGKVPTRDEMKKCSSYSVSTFERAFGGWNKFIQGLGYEVNKRNSIPKSDFVVEFNKVKNLLGHAPSSEEMSKYGSISPSSYRRIWGSWSAFLKDMGESFQKRNILEDELVKEYLKLKKVLKKDSLTQKDMNEFGKFSSASYERRYGSWSKFLISVGDKPNVKIGISKKELIDDYFRIKAEINKTKPSANDIKLYSMFSLSVYINRYGSWSNFLREIEQ